MSEVVKTAFDPFFDEIRKIVREEIAAALANGNGHAAEGDRLLNPEEAAEILNVDVRWLYRHSKKLPFTRKLSRKALRFSRRGLLRWKEAKKG